MKIKILKIRIKVFNFIQGTSIFLTVIFSTLGLAGSELQSTQESFLWQYRTCISYILLFISIIGCMELLKRFTRYQILIIRRNKIEHSSNKRTIV